jgi:hypothetical protein
MSFTSYPARRHNGDFVVTSEKQRTSSGEMELENGDVGAR